MPIPRRLVLVALLSLFGQIDAAVVPELPRSVSFPEERASFSMASLRGKAVVILFYQSWCPKCNQWSPTLIKQVTERYGQDRRVALVGVKTDGGGPDAAISYLRKAGDPGPWLIASDARDSWYKQVTGDDKLFVYAIVAPDGRVVEVAKTGMLQNTKNGKRFTLASNKLPLTGVTTVLPAEATYAKAVRAGVTAAEAGDFATALTIAKKAGKAGKPLWNDLLAALEKRSDAWLASLAKGTPIAERLEAYCRLCTELRGSAIAKKAQSPLKTAARDRALKKELKAKTAYEGILAKAQKVPADKRQAAIAAVMKQLAKRYDETVYGAKAADWHCWAERSSIQGGLQLAAVQ